MQQQQAGSGRERPYNGHPVRHIGDYANISYCCWCEKPFQDGSASRRVVHSIRILIKYNRQYFRVHGNVCGMCTTRLSDLQVSSRSATMEGRLTGDSLPFGGLEWDSDPDNKRRFVPSVAPQVNIRESANSKFAKGQQRRIVNDEDVAEW